MLQQDHFWPTTMYFKDHPDPAAFNLDLEKKIIAWSQSDPGLAKTNRFGWHSTTDMHTRAEFAGITNYLMQMQHEIYQAEGLAGTPVLGNMWANINYPGASNAMHIHPNSLWSGAYYVTCCADSGNIYFEDPRSVSLMTMPRYQTEQALNSRRIIDSQPRPGRLIMFPSWVNHGVRENTSNQTRISISFNFIQGQ